MLKKDTLDTQGTWNFMTKLKDKARLNCGVGTYSSVIDYNGEELDKREEIVYKESDVKQFLEDILEWATKEQSPTNPRKFSPNEKEQKLMMGGFKTAMAHVHNKIKEKSGMFEDE